MFLSLSLSLYPSYSLCGHVSSLKLYGHTSYLYLPVDTFPRSRSPSFWTCLLFSSTSLWTCFLSLLLPICVHVSSPKKKAAAGKVAAFFSFFFLFFRVRVVDSCWDSHTLSTSLAEPQDEQTQEEQQHGRSNGRSKSRISYPQDLLTSSPPRSRVTPAEEQWSCCCWRQQREEGPEGLSSLGHVTTLDTYTNTLYANKAASDVNTMYICIQSNERCIEHNIMKYVCRAQ